MTEAAEALIELLDEDDLIPKYVVTQEGDPDRMETVWPDLTRAYVAHCVHDREVEG